MRMRRKWEGNEKESFQLFVGVFDTCLVWYLLVLPSETHVVANMNYLRAIDGNTSNHFGESDKKGGAEIGRVPDANFSEFPRILPFAKSSIMRIGT